MANPYDDIVATYAGESSTPNASANPYDAVVDDVVGQRQQRARTAYEKALATNPDRAAEAQRLAKQTGLPPDTVERNIDDVRRKEQARLLDLARMAEESPILARQLADPTFTKQAHDDVGALGQVEQFFRNTGGSVKAGVFNASKGAAGVFRAGFEVVAPVLDFLEPVTSIGGNPLRRIAEGFALSGQSADTTAKSAAPKTEGNISGGFQSGIQSLTQNMLALPLAFMPGGQTAALTMMTANTGGQSYQDARTKGLSMSEALPFAASQAAIEYATERIPLGDLIRDLKVGAPLLQTVTNQLKGELAGEQIATVLQDLNEWAVLNPEKPFSEYIAARPDAAAQTLVATVVGTGGNIAVASGIETATRRLMGSAYDAGLAEQHADHLQGALQVAAASRLRERNPEQFRTLMQQMSENTEGAPQEVFVDAEVLNQMPAEVLAQLPQSVRDALPDALTMNDVVSIPVADVLTVAPGTPLEQILAENARIGDPMAMTQAEAKTAGERAQQYLAQEAERVIAQATDAQAMQDSSDRVKAGLVEQLNTAGRFSPAVNDAYATWTTAFYTTMGGRLGLTPEAMAERYPLRIGAQGQGGAVLSDAQQLQQQFNDLLVAFDKVDATIEITAPQMTKQEIDDAETAFLSTRPEGTTKYGRESGIARRLRSASDRATNELGGEAETAREVTDSSLGPFSGYRVEGDFVAPDEFYNPQGALKVRVYGKEQLDAGLNEEPALTFTVMPDGELSVNGPTPGGATFNEFQKRGWAEHSQAAGQIAEGWSNLINPGGGKMPMGQVMNLLADVHARVKAWKMEDYTGVHWARSTGALPGTGDSGSAMFFQGGQTETPEFKKWFGDSKVVDADGKPLVVYHGTTKDFTEFDPTRVGENFGVDEEGFFFTSDPINAARYADPESAFAAAGMNTTRPPVEGANVMPVYLAVQNPLTLEAYTGAFYTSPAVEIDEQGISLTDYFDDNRQSIMQFVKDSGHDGVVFQHKGKTLAVALSPTQIKSTTGNAGTFDPNDPSILKQGPRATFNPETLELVLNENADLSSFLHETGHFFLEVMADLASQPDAPAEIQADMAALLKWFGVADFATWNGYDLEQKRQYHERFAESFEQYLLEGKAPSVELQPLFRKFRAWMLNVYKSINTFLNSHPDSGMTLSDEIRQVFDRMIASEAQIAEAEEVAGLAPDQDATNEAVEKLTARSLRDLKWTINARGKEVKKLQKQAAEMRKSVEAEVRAEVEAMPVYAARIAMRGDSKLDVSALEDLYAGEGDRYALLDWKPLVTRRLAGKDGMHPDIVADMFGFTSGDAMVRAVLDAEPIASVIEGRTDQRMLEEHGDLIDERAIAQAANEAIHNEARARSLATELKAQADALNPRTETGETNTGGAKITVNALTAAAKQFASNVIARTPLRDLKSKAWQHTAAERRAGKRWQEHTAKGETQDAIKAKQDQMLNHAAAKAAMDAQEEMRKVLEFFRRVVKDGDEKTVDKGRDPDVVNAARAILGAYGVGGRMAKSALDYMALVEKNDPAMYAALGPSMQATLSMAQPLDALTMDELRSLHDEIQGMWHLAKRSRQMEVDGNLLDIEDAEAELQARMQALGVPDSLPGETGAITPKQKAQRMLQHAGSLLRRAEQWAEGMDGQHGGPFLRLVFSPIKSAADAYRTDRVQYRKAYQALIDQVAPFMPKGLVSAPELNYTFGEGHNGIGMAELLHAILHTGNDSNRRKLLLGRKWAIENEDGTLDTARWDAFLRRMHDTGILNKAHYDFAQGVWDLLEQTKPLAQKAHRDTFGRYFAEVTADAFETPFGTYRGGYVPAQADPEVVQDAALRDLANLENENMAFSFPAPNKGFTKSRVEYNRPLKLDLRTIGQHIDKVLLFAHMAPAARDVNKLLSRKGVSYSLGRIDPTIYAGMLTPWLKRSATQVVETPTAGDGGLMRILSAARSRAGMSLMFANVSNTLQQVTGFSTAFAKLKADGLESHMMRAAAQYLAHPRDLAKTVAAASPYMENRMGNEVAAINAAMDEILLDPGLYEKTQAWFQKHAYFMQSALDNTMGPIIWTAAYNGHLTKHGDEKAAAKYADGVIRQTQGSTLPEDVSRIETGNAFFRMFTQFIGYFNMMANTNATALKQIAQEEGLRKGAGKALMVVTMGMLVPIWTAELIAVAMRGGPGDEDDDGYLDDWIAAVLGMGTIKGTFAMVPFVGQLANASINRFNSNPADDKMSLSPAVSLLESAVGVPTDVYKAITDPEKLNRRNAVRDVSSLVSIATGLPANALARPLGYAAGVADDRIEPTGTGDAVRGMITGSASPESKSR